MCGRSIGLPFLNWEANLRGIIRYGRKPEELVLYLAKLPKLPLLRKGSKRVLGNRDTIDTVLGEPGVGRLGLLVWCGPAQVQLIEQLYSFGALYIDPLDCGIDLPPL